MLAPHCMPSHKIEAGAALVKSVVVRSANPQAATATPDERSLLEFATSESDVIPWHSSLYSLLTYSHSVPNISVTN